MWAHFGAHTCVQVFLDKAICDELALARYVRPQAYVQCSGSRGGRLVVGNSQEGGNDDVLCNAHSAISNDEKASTHELGRGHGHKRKSTASNALAGYSIGMPTVSTYARSACVTSQSADNRRRASNGCRLGHVLLLAIGAYLCLGLRLFAQTPDPLMTEEANKSWTATTDLNSSDANPTRIIESHSQNGKRTLDKRSVQIRGFDGRFDNYQDIETETLQLDPTTVRTTTRTFSRDGSGRRTLAQVTEEEKDILPCGDSNIVRLTSSSDLNGALQPIRRDIVETNNVGNSVEEANTTVLLPSIYGGFAPAMKMHELRKRGPNDTIESQITTLLLDGSGNWQVSEIRQNTITQAPNNGRTEERVFGLDSGGRLGEVSRRVSKESENRFGEKVHVLETYSVSVPGRAQDGNLHLVQRATTAMHTSATGERITEQKVEVSHSGEPGSGLRSYMLITDTVRPAPSGFQATRTVCLRDLNGNVEVVEVDTTKSDKVLTIQVQQTPAEKPE